jgi:H+/Cl- antiporter ClcA
MVEAGRWLLSIGLGGFGALSIVGNWASLVGALLSKKPTSLVPLIGGLACAIACLLCPESRVRSLAWCPLMADLSISLMLPLFLFHRFARLVGWTTPSGSGPIPSEPKKQVESPQ